MGLSKISPRHRADSNGSQTSSSTRLLGSPKRTRALLSIRPHYASAIMNGKKRYEFRRTIFALPVKVVVLYATVPVQRVVAEFDVKSVMSGKPERLWKRTQRFAGIERSRFFEYFRGK